MTPTKKKTTAKKSDKRLKMDNTKFKSLQHFERYTRFYIKATIIQEIEGHFHSKLFSGQRLG